ncbi:hypothetical protein ABZW47_29690 [Streptomyces sp. NPDC004549]|uniref:hypothetical protein n=1 Tax=Streptomyces sp. NPDC004549 TaxID=3154283 RepID=UPI0033BD9A90
MQAEFVPRRVAQMVAAIFAATFIIAAPAAPKAHALPDPSWFNPIPCNSPGGKWVCDKAKEGAKWLYDKSGADSVVDSVSSATDFAADPLGYLEQKLRSGTKGMFAAFGEELTGKKPADPTDGKKGKGD